MVEEIFEFGSSEMLQNEEKEARKFGNSQREREFEALRADLCTDTPI